MAIHYAHRRIRRTATSALAGYHDWRPARDVLTSLLNGADAFADLQKAEEAKYARRDDKRPRYPNTNNTNTNNTSTTTNNNKGKQKATEYHHYAKGKSAGPSNASDTVTVFDDHPSTSSAPASSSPATDVRKKAGSVGRRSKPPTTAVAAAPAKTPTVTPAATASTSAAPGESSAWQNRPSINIATMQRSKSVTPPPMPPLSPEGTPAPSVSSATSRQSSKRPLTPDDFEDMVPFTPRPLAPVVKKKKVAHKKGWKGWVSMEGSPPPSEKLINLDKATLLPGRSTRSGKSFDAWV